VAGGKQENKKFSLVRWEQVVLPYEQGGLSIQTPRVMNAALGMKIVWRLIIGKGSWWRKTLISNMDGSMKRLLNGNIPIRQCTQAWKLVKKTIPLMSRYISKILSNGKTISIWEDKIMGKEPLQNHLEIEDIQEWMKGKGFNTLHSISLWNQKEWQD